MPCKLHTALFFVLILGYLAALMVGPRIPADQQKAYCAYNVHIAGPFGQSLNCDSPAFLADAAYPQRIYAPEGRRQDRPGAGLTVHILSQPFVWAFKAAGMGEVFALDEYTQERKAQNERENEIDPKQLLPYYLGYAVLKVLVLALSFILFLKAANLPLKWETLASAAAWMGLLLVVNNITKQYFWSPHTQVFNILAAMTALYGFQTVLKTERPFRFFWAMALACGIGMLYYGIFVISITVTGLALVWRLRDDLFSNPATFVRNAAENLAAIALFALPYALWAGLMIALNGEFYHHDAQAYTGFRWMGQTASEYGGIIAIQKFVSHAINLLGGALVQGWIAFLLLAGLAYTNKKQTGRIFHAPSLWAGAALYGLLYTLFFCAYNLHSERISAILVILIAPILADCVNTQNLTKIQSTVITAGWFAYAGYAVIKFGPYS